MGRLPIVLVDNLRFVLDPLCISCTAPADDPNTIAVSDHWKVVLHPDQTVPGALLLVTLRHVTKLSELSDDESAEFAPLVAAVERVLERRLGATMVNFSCLRNWAYRTTDPDPPFRDGRPNPHVHWHVAPRFDAPVTIGGETFVDDDFGEQLVWRHRWPAEPVRLELIGRIGPALVEECHG